MAVVVIQSKGTIGGDTLLESNNPTFNFGLTQQIRAGNTAALVSKALLKFDLSSIPAGATITSAVLTLYQTGQDNAIARTIYVMKGLTAFYEGNKDQAVPTTGLASSWSKRDQVAGTNWSSSTPGGQGVVDYSTSATASASVNSVGGTHNWTVTADVQAWFASPSTNHGWWLVSSGSEIDSRKHFASFDATTASQRPKLTVTYSGVPSYISGSAAGTCTVTGTLAKTTAGFLSGSAAGTVAAIGTLSTEEYGPVIVQPDPAAGIDTRLMQDFPTTDQGTSTILSAGHGGAGVNVRRGLIKFDLSFIPPDAIIQRAAVVMFVRAVSSGQNPNTIGLHRSLVEWYEGGSATDPPSGGDASTWNFRNYTGSVPWAGGPGGQVGTEWLSKPTSSVVFTGPPVEGSAHEWVVTDDIQDFVNSFAPPTTYDNYGWWVIAEDETQPATGFNSKAFFTSDHTTNPNLRPYLVVDYIDTSTEMQGLAAGTSEVTAKIQGQILISGLSEGTSEATGMLESNAAVAVADGTSTVTGTLKAIGYMYGEAAGSSTAVANLRAIAPLSGLSEGTSEVSGNGVFGGMLRGSSEGIATVTGTMWGRATGKKAVEICDTTPLLYITDGSYLPNGQLDMLNLISSRIGFLLKDWDPSLAQYKEGGYFSDSALGQGRRLSRRVFENAIEIMSISLKGDSQNQAIFYLREYLRWQELAADYWTSDWSVRPVYLVARSAKETKIRYAIVHVMSLPAVTNPYAQPFFGTNVTAMEDLAFRIEREPWTDYPPGEFEVVPISSIRPYKVAGWSV